MSKHVLCQNLFPMHYLLLCLGISYFVVLSEFSEEKSSIVVHYIITHGAQEIQHTTNAHYFYTELPH